MPDTRCWILDTGYWMLDTGCWILDAEYSIVSEMLESSIYNPASSS